VARITKDTKVLALKRSPLFEGLNRKQLQQLARVADDRDVEPGTVLCKEGSRGREFFVIVEGEASVSKAGKRIANLGSGDFFGEIALLERVERTATVTAKTPLRFFVVTDHAFKTVVATDPRIERSLLRALARRLLPNTADPETR
jgi:CRP-like cAMP-binding protein